MRVCGMVKNEGEPGGGLHIVRNAEGITSLQILESSQINKNDPAKNGYITVRQVFQLVDLVCSVRTHSRRAL